jgi:hypothetical protein
MPIFMMCLIPNKGNQNATDISTIYLKLRSLCAQAGIKLLATAADGAKAEFNAQRLLEEQPTRSRLEYSNEKYMIKLGCPIFDDTGPLVPVTDPSHARKTARNNFTYGTHLLTLGNSYLCHSVLMELLKIDNCPLYVKDVYNVEKQDDGAARRLFISSIFSLLVDEKGQLVDEKFEGFWVLSFIFGLFF